MSTARRIVSELVWWLAALGRALACHRVLLLVATGLAFVVAALGQGWWRWLLLALVPVLVELVWERCGPVSYRRHMVERRFRRQTSRFVRQSWPELLDSCGLGRRRGPSDRVEVPGLVGIRWESAVQLAVELRLLSGQTPEDVELASERLRVALQAHQCRVELNESRSGCRLVWSFGDALAEPFARPVLDGDAPVDLDSVPLGRCEDGSTWRLPLRVSTLVAGSSGSGKGSILWGTVCSLGPAIKAGLVEVYGIDLKGGMELAMGRASYAQLATDPLEAVTLLEQAADRCSARTRKLAGRVRSHTPTPEEPLVLVLIDELASLVAYLTDRDLLRRAEAALSRLLSTGRAPGFYVHAYLQDPRKETVRMRHLFTQAVGLRLRDREEVAMVHGDGAIRAGAMCHKISSSTPGVGYALGENGQIVRVRAALVSDDVIRETARHFPAPTQRPVVVPVDVSPVSARPSGRRRSTQKTTETTL